MRVFVCCNGTWRDRAAIRAALAAFPSKRTTILATRPGAWADGIAAGMARRMGFACAIFGPRGTDASRHKGTRWHVTMRYACDARPAHLVIAAFTFVVEPHDLLPSRRECVGGVMVAPLLPYARNVAVSSYRSAG